jgi:hypothetical protein
MGLRSDGMKKFQIAWGYDRLSRNGEHNYNRCSLKKNRFVAIRTRTDPSPQKKRGAQDDIDSRVVIIIKQTLKTRVILSRQMRGVRQRPGLFFGDEGSVS